MFEHKVPLPVTDPKDAQRLSGYAWAGVWMRTMGERDRLQLPSKTLSNPQHRLRDERRSPIATATPLLRAIFKLFGLRGAAN